MKRILMSAVFALIINTHAAAQQKMYFDENWEKTTRDKMEFYRETETKGKLTLIRDFYKNGTLQMEGLVSDATPGSEVYEGKVTWYYIDGTVLSMATYSSGIQIGPAKTFDEQGRVTEDFIYKAEGTFTGTKYTYKNPDEMSYNNSITTYETPDNYKTVVYDEDIKGIRYEIVSDGKELYEVKFYGEKGKYIGANNTGGSRDNILVDYYQDPMKVSKIVKQNKEGNVIESTIYSPEGKILQEDKKSKKGGYQKTYDKSGKQIGNLTYAYNKETDYYFPQDGEEYDFNYEYSGFTAVTLYKNGSAVLNKYFDEDGKLSSEKVLKEDITQEIRYYHPDGRLKSTLTYQDDQPYNGTLYEALMEQQYKDGIVIQSKSFRLDKKLKNETKINADKTVYNSTVYDENGAIAYTYSHPLEQDNGFTAQIVQYTKGKAGSKAVVKDGILQSGKIKYKSELGWKELERSGKWIIVKMYDTEGKLVQDSKVLAETQEMDAYNSLSTQITEADLQYESYESL